MVSLLPTLQPQRMIHTWQRLRHPWCGARTVEQQYQRRCSNIVRQIRRASTVPSTAMTTSEADQLDHRRNNGWGGSGERQPQSATLDPSGSHVVAEPHA